MSRSLINFVFVTVKWHNSAFQPSKGKIYSLQRRGIKISLIPIGQFSINSVKMHSSIQKALLALLVNVGAFAPTGGTSCIGYKFSQQMVPLELVTSLATRWRHLHCHIALECPIGIIS